MAFKDRQTSRLFTERILLFKRSYHNQNAFKDRLVGHLHNGFFVSTLLYTLSYNASYIKKKIIIMIISQSLSFYCNLVDFLYSNIYLQPTVPCSLKFFMLIIRWHFKRFVILKFNVFLIFIAIT